MHVYRGIFHSFLFLDACRCVPRVALDNEICFPGSISITRWPVCGWILPPAVPEVTAETLARVNRCPGIRSPLQEAQAAMECHSTGLWGRWFSADQRTLWGEHMQLWGPSIPRRRVSAGCRQGTWVPAHGEKLGRPQPAPLCSQLLSQVQNVFLAVITGYYISS